MVNRNGVNADQSQSLGTAEHDEVENLLEALTVQGVKGVSIWGGYVSEEYLPDLKPWTRAVKVYLQMVNDPTVGTMLDALKMPILSSKAAWSVTPASDATPDVEAAEFLQANMDNMERQSWRSFIGDALEMVDFGFYVGEIVMEKRDDGRIWIKNIETRGQETLLRWGIDDHLNAVSFIQGLAGTMAIRKTVEIPLEKCVHAVFRGRKGNPEGKSLLRSVYRPWYFASNLETFEAIGVERDVGGMPMATLEKGVPFSPANITKLKAALKGLRVDEQAQLIIPPGITVQPYASGSKAYDVRAIIEAKRKEILMRGFAQFLALGMDQVGTQALVEGSQDFFSLGIEALQESLKETLQTQLVPYLFRWNEMPGMTDFPQLEWNSPGGIDVDSFVNAYTRGVSGGLITPLREDEVRVRAEMDLPELGEEDGNHDRMAGMAGGADDLGPFDIGDGAGMGGEEDGEEPFPFRSLDFAAADPAFRPAANIFSSAANAYQRDLVKTYDVWARETLRLAQLPDRTAASIADMVDGRMEKLSVDMRMLGRKHISKSSGLGLGKILGKRASSPRVLGTVSNLINRNDRFIMGSLIPDLRTKFQAGLPALLSQGEVSGDAAKALMAGPRARVASYSGGATVAIFKTQEAAGIEENEARVSEGQAPIKTRWNLEPSADHCGDDPNRGTLGCVGLARVYNEGWGSMPTVPAGNVSCLGNCQCYIDFDFGDGRGYRRVD